jgi:hypothetical protein
LALPITFLSFLPGKINPGPGSAYLFDGGTGALRLTFNNPNPTANDAFGFAVAGMGTNVLIGAFGEDPGGIVDAGAAIYLMGTPERCA